MSKTAKQSLMEMAQGAIKERVDYEVARIVDNILDPNTDDCKKRKLTLTIDFTPSEDRQVVSISATAKSTLAPATAIRASLMFVPDRNGEPVLTEMGGQLPGQMDMDGNEAEEPDRLQVVGSGNALDRIAQMG